MASGGYTHIQTLCCHTVLKPLASLPPAKPAYRSMNSQRNSYALPAGSTPRRHAQRRGTTV
jgi:hypothetical protein